MSARSKKVKSQIGRALYNSCGSRHAKSTGSRVARHTSLIEKQEVPASLTILEQTHLEEFIHSTELAKAKYDAERPEFVQGELLKIVGDSDRAALHTRSKYDIQEEASRILRRPKWNTSMTAMDIRDAEDRAFLDWRRALAEIEETEGVVLSPFERNVDFWRQLWRTVERSDLVVQIVDARDPLFFLSTDLFKYVQEVAEFQNKPKNCLLLINKADFVSNELRVDWEQYFERNHSFPFVQFSALHELSSSATEETEDGPVDPEKGVLGFNASGLVNADELIELFTHKYSPRPGEPITVGMVGFPNVGKSSVINALLGAKKVSASSTPGKTKHIQTITLNEDITLCDCPGIVLPSVVASKAHLVVNATMPLDHLRGGLEPAIDLVVERMGFKTLIEFYKCQHALLPQFLKLGSEARALLSAVAVAKKYFLALNVPDESKAARLVLKDVCTGRLVHVMHPPGSAVGADLDLIEEESYAELEEEEEEYDAFAVGESQQAPEVLEDDIADFLKNRDESFAQPRRIEEAEAKPLTKRAARMGAKKDMKNKNKYTAMSRGTGELELAQRISMLKPGSRGRVNKKLADPYGCHRDIEL